ncbi:cocaine esterase-like [Paramacrobiotus metropolitanus]|uniref:cocaine esterase-like n=1 Tax=Paramacrobiotus metropolitanus TaxID=2943436 RepID=UPI0024463525|nr:cocaine esterase-like [Paramacrobiotus metropolitanus]
MFMQTAYKLPIVQTHKGYYEDHLTTTKLKANIDWNALYQGNVKLGNYLIAGELINTTVSGWNAWVYPGIKYASARRFSNPILNEDLSYYGNINNNVDKHGPACWQSARISPDIRMDEDCLYLDVYVPPVAPTASSNFLHPVLFWVHGSFGAEGDVLGGQKKGAGNIVQTIPAIVVPVQYRTGVFGFLSTEDSVAPGNWGLADLKAAFEWLYATVEAFGGDKKRIVLGGHDTGASLISAMMLDPNIRNRVHSTLLMSGSLLAPWAMSKDSSSDTMKLAALMNCSAVQMTSAAIFNCLTNRSATDMLRAADAIALTDPSMRHMSWKLVVDGHHILYDPVVLFDDRHPWNFSGGSVYTVQTADAASLIGHHKQHMFGQGLPKITYALDTYINDIIPMGTGCHALPNATMDALIQKYNLLGGPEGADPDVLRFNMIRLANDLLFVTPITQEAALYAIHNHAAKGTQVVVLDYEMANEDQTPVQRENLHGIEFGTSIKLLASPNHQKDSSTTLLTRELSMLLNSILQRGYGFGENFDPMVGNYLELGLAKRWTKKRSMSFLGELNFHDFLMQQGCIDPTESSRQRSGVFSRDLSISPAPPIPEQPNNPGAPLITNP